MGGANGVVQVAPVTVAQRARPAAHEERGQGGATHRDRLVFAKSKHERQQLVRALADRRMPLPGPAAERSEVGPPGVA